MPRHSDETLESHILEAAYQLWTQGGEKALTVRAVARAARTTTPTVYERFRDKREILERIRRRALQKLFDLLRRTGSLEDFPQTYLDFAVSHPHEYRLVHADWAVRFGRNEPRPSFDLLRERLAGRFGGAPAEYTRLALSMAALAHGTATLLLGEDVHAGVGSSLREAFNASFRALLEHAAESRKQKQRSPQKKIREA